MKSALNVVVGTPIYRVGAYILDKFMMNQKEIQQNYPFSELVLATVEHDFGSELEMQLNVRGLKGKVLHYDTIKPEYARSPIWNIACGREAIRQYMLLQTEASYLVCLDADMTYDPSIIEIMEREIQGYDVVYSGYALRNVPGIALAGGGCCMLTAAVLRGLRFRCLEFKNGVTILEDAMLELDLIKSRKRIKRGFFIATNHYGNTEQVKHISPHPVGLYRRITHSVFVRYILIRASIAFKHNIGDWLNSLVYRLLGALRAVSLLSKRR
jgi:hypothetical protein